MMVRGKCNLFLKSSYFNHKPILTAKKQDNTEKGNLPQSPRI
uniref:Uncharacterized protein n=1 Tax=Siphoviridae sp. ctCsv15 TaxID=2826195 RepID=A0A8S5LZ25_9CAUD|nr:MAG TPA: hypothetical protein [Siphoviridae sp. ctCsv15]